jgi:hypothetical protein
MIGIEEKITLRRLYMELDLRKWKCFGQMVRREFHADGTVWLRPDAEETLGICFR